MLEPLAELQEDLLTEERNTLSLQLRIDCEADKLDDILSSDYLRESDHRVQQMVKQSQNGLKKIVRKIKAARPADSQVLKNVLSITKRGVGLNKLKKPGDDIPRIIGRARVIAN